MKNIIIYLVLSLLISVSHSATKPINAIGTTLPPLWPSVNYRVFNDLMKQSAAFVPYQFIYGSVSRYWGYSLAFINGLGTQYPASLATNVYAAA